MPTETEVTALIADLDGAAGVCRAWGMSRHAQSVQNCAAALRALAEENRNLRTARDNLVASGQLRERAVERLAAERDNLKAQVEGTAVMNRALVNEIETERKQWAALDRRQRALESELTMKAVAERDRLAVCVASLQQTDTAWADKVTALTAAEQAAFARGSAAGQLAMREACSEGICDLAQKQRPLSNDYRRGRYDGMAASLRVIAALPVIELKEGE